MECKLNTETVVIAVQDCPDNMPALGMTYSPWQQSVSYTHLTLPTNREV